MNKFVEETGVATRGWFTRDGDRNPEDNEDRSWRDLTIGMGRLGEDAQGSKEEGEEEEEEEQG